MLQSESLARISQALSGLATRGTEISEMTIPRLFGKGAASERAATAVSQAATDAETATMLLGMVGFPRSAGDAVRDAARMLRETPVARGTLGDAGKALSDAAVATQARIDSGEFSALMSENPAAPEDVIRLFDREPKSLTTAEWKQLHTVLTADPEGSVLTGPRLIGSYKFDAWTQALADGNKATDSVMEQYFAAWRTHYASPEQLREHAANLIARDPASYTPSDVAMLKELLAADPDGTIIRGNRAIEGAGDLNSGISSYVSRRTGISPTIIRHVNAWKAADTPAAQIASEAKALFQRDPKSLTKEDWGRLTVLLDLDSEAKVLTGPRALGQYSLTGWTTSLADGRVNPDANIERYFAHWRLNGATPAQLSEQANALLARDPASYTVSDIAQLDALLAADSEGKILTGNRNIAAAGDLTANINKILTTTDRNFSVVARHVNAWKLADTPAEQLASEAKALFAREPETLTKEDWTRLTTLLDADPEGKILTGPRSMGKYGLTGWTTSLSTDRVKPDGNIQRYFAAWRQLDTSPEQLREQAATLLARDPATFTRADFAELDTLLAADPDGTILTGNRNIPGAGDLAATLQDVLVNSSTNSRAIIRHLNAWKLADVSAAEIASEAKALLTREPESLSTEEWSRLTTLLDADPEGKILTGPRSIGKYTLSAWTSSLARGEVKPEGPIQRYFEHWRVHDMPIEQRRELAAALIARDPATFTSTDISKLDALLTFDTDATILTGNRAIPGVGDLTEAIDSFLSGGSKQPSVILRHINAWKAASVGAEQMQREASALFERDPGSFTKEDWTRLTALLDADPEGAILTGPRKLGQYALAPWTNTYATRGGVPGSEIQRYFAHWRMNDTPIEHQRELAEALLARDPATYTTADVAQLDTLLSIDPDGKVITGNRAVASIGNLTESLNAVLAGKPKLQGVVNRYVNAWKLADVTAEQRVREARTLYEREPASLSKEDWTRLTSLLDSDPEGKILTGPRMVGKYGFSAWTNSLAIGESKPGRELERYFAHWRMNDTPVAQQRELAEALLARDPATYTTADVAQLDALLSVDPNGAIITGNRNIASAGHLQQSLDAALTGKSSEFSSVIRHVNAWKLADMPAAQIVSETRALIERDPTTLTTSDWQHLTSLLDADADGAILTGPRKLGSYALSAWTNSYSTGTPAPGEDIRRYFAAWRKVLDPEYQAKRAAAVQGLTDGTLDVAGRQLLLDEGADVMTLVQNAPLAAQARAAALLLDSTYFAATPKTAGLLTTIRSFVADRTDIPAELEDLRAETLKLIDSNISRMKGVTLKGDVRGYSSHPDYAQIGEIRSNLQMMDMYAGTRTRAAAPATAPSDVISW